MVVINTLDHWKVRKLLLKIFQDYLIECCNFSDPTPSASSIVQVDHLYLDLKELFNERMGAGGSLD